MASISPFVAFLAGVLSFLSPCVLPLVPGYLSLMSGVSIEKLKAGEAGATRAVVLSAIVFILGFSLVFIAMGASASYVSELLKAHRPLLGKIAGVIIILFGVFLLGLIKFPALYREKRFQGETGKGLGGSFLLGLAFAFGWTPCIGPILAGILGLAAVQETKGYGVYLLSIYSLGLGVPFLLTALGINKFLGFYKGFRRHLQWVERVAGVLLIAVGVLVATNQLGWLSRYFTFFNQFNLEIPLESSAQGAAGPQAEAGEMAPDPDLQLADGTTLHLSDLRGQVVVVNFWATWCLPCRLEIPFFNKIAEEYRSQGVVFVGVSLDEGGWADIQKFQEETPILYTVALDQRQQAAGAFGVSLGLPTTFFIDRQGRIAHQQLGITDVDTLRGHIEALL